MATGTQNGFPRTQRIASQPQTLHLMLKKVGNAIEDRVGMTMRRSSDKGEKSVPSSR